MRRGILFIFILIILSGFVLAQSATTNPSDDTTTPPAAQTTQTLDWTRWDEIKESLGRIFNIGNKGEFWVIDGDKCVNLTATEYEESSSTLKYYSSEIKCKSALEYAIKKEQLRISKSGGFLSRLWYGSSSLFGDNFAWLIGAKDWQGKDVGISAAIEMMGGFWISMLVLLGGSFTIALLLIVFLSIINISEIPYGKVSLLSIALSVFIFILYYRVANYEHIFTGVIACGIFLLVYFLANKFGDNKNKHKVVKSHFYIIIWRISILLIVYPALMSIPVTNRAIQIITFETLMPDSWFIRSFILAFYVGIIPIIFKQYSKYKDRQKIYEEKLKEEVGKETSRIMASG